MKNYYHILGISNDASNEEIKEAYRKLSKKFHPDTNNGDPFFVEQLRQVQEAYQILSDSWSRQSYDYQLNTNYHKIAHPPTNPQRSLFYYFGEPSYRRTIILMGITALVASLVLWYFIRPQYSNKSVVQQQTPHLSTSNHTATSTPIPTTINTNAAAVKTVEQWINNIGQRNFPAAHQLMYQRGSFRHFRSSQAYGGIYKTTINICYLKAEQTNTAIVIADYDSYDRINRSGNFMQTFYLIKKNDQWLIQKIENLKTYYF